MKDFLPNSCSMMYFVQVAMPKLLKHCAATRCPPSILREACHEQLHFVSTGCVPRAVVQHATDLLALPSGSMRGTTNKNGTVRYYVTASKYINTPVTLQSTAARKITPSAVETFEGAAARTTAIHTVLKVMTSDKPNYYQCDCKSYFVSGYLCSHVLLAMHFEEPGHQLNKYTARFTGPKPPGSRSKAYSVTNCSTEAPTGPSGGATSNSTSSSSSAINSSDDTVPQWARGVNVVGATIRGIGTTAHLKSGVVVSYNTQAKSYAAVFDGMDGEIEVNLSGMEVHACYVAQVQHVEAQKAKAAAALFKA